jgi:agmatinase
MSNPSAFFAFLSQATFLKTAAAPLSAIAKTTQPFGLAGVAWDGCVTNRPGSRFGPRGIRDASHMLCDGIHPVFNVSPVDHLVDFGDLPLPNTSLVAMREAMMPFVKDLIAAKHMVFVGGDHSITLPILRAHHERLGKPLAVLHFDAHCDTWVDHFGEPSGHGTWVYEAIKEGIAIKECFFQMGIRSSGERTAREYVKDQGGIIYTAKSLRGLDGPGLNGVLATIRERLKAHGNPPIYLTLDIDCLDPAFAPGTGTPEPAGLTTSQVQTVLEELHDLNWIGMDCVEVAPPYDHAELTSMAASNFVWTYLSGRIAAGAAVPDSS